VEILRDWVSSGRLVDPYEELLVKESKFIDRGILDMDYVDEYWKRRYTVMEFSLCSFVMDQYLLDHRNDTRWVFHHLDQRRLHSPPSRKLETQYSSGWKVPECNSRMRYRRTQRPYHTEEEELSMENERYCVITMFILSHVVTFSS
jgi:gamma-tubulin complex component 2